MNIQSCAVSAPGSAWAQNQDNLYMNGVYRNTIENNAVWRHENYSTGSGLYAVADGIGGDQNGALASLLTVQAMDNIGSQTMTQYLQERNAVICALIEKKGGAHIGSTFAGLSVNGSAAEVVNVGNSRVYLFREGTLLQQSRDHTQRGSDGPEATLTHPERMELTQHLGTVEMLINPFEARFELAPNDLILLCSDGLTAVLEDHQIADILDMPGSLAKRADMLIQAAVQNNSRDSITVLLVHTEPEEAGGVAPKPHRGFKQRMTEGFLLPFITTGLMLFAAAAVGWAILSSNQTAASTPGSMPTIEPSPSIDPSPSPIIDPSPNPSLPTPPPIVVTPPTPAPIPTVQPDPSPVPSPEPTPDPSPDPSPETPGSLEP